MDPRAYRIAHEFVAKHLRLAKYSPEFMAWAGGRRFPNPNPDGRLKDVQFESLPDEEQARIYAQWSSKAQQGEGAAAQKPPPLTRDQIHQQALDIARKGEILSRKELSAGGSDGPGINVSEIVRMKLGDQTQIFIRKPASGEEAFIRPGIQGGTYHAREAAAYALDSLLGREGSIVPPTISRGSEDGSYQVWSSGGKQFRDEDMENLVKKVPLQELSRSPSFHRLNVLDLIQGHEDRHPGNLLFAFDGEETPENLRFIAIDNGLAMSSPLPDPGLSVHVNPFRDYYHQPENSTWEEDRKIAVKTEKEGDAIVAKSLSRIDPKLHAQLKEVDLSDAAKGMTDAGVTDEMAVRATLVRIAALQADPRIFKDLLEENDGDLTQAWQVFQYLSGHNDDLLWRSGAGEDAEQRINQALSKARPKGGWSKPFEPESRDEIFARMNGWGDIIPPSAAPQKDDETDFSMLASKVGERWIRAKVTGNTRGHKLTVYHLTPGKESKELGTFELLSNKKVKESYRDNHFRSDIHSGLNVMGRKFTPKDGPAFMAALEKVYGVRSMFDVIRS